MKLNSGRYATNLYSVSNYNGCNQLNIRVGPSIEHLIQCSGK
jgi:hypothetical protein